MQNQTKRQKTSKANLKRKPIKSNSKINSNKILTLMSNKY
jgi:hypothetical protein